MPTPADRDSLAPDHVIPFRLPAWLGWTCAFVLLLTTGYFAISNFNARQQVDALRTQAQASDIEAQSLKNLLTAEQIISAKQIEALKAAQAEVAELKSKANSAKQWKPTANEHFLTISGLLETETPVIATTVFKGKTLVWYHDTVSTHHSTCFPRTGAITIESPQPQNLKLKFDPENTIYPVQDPANTKFVVPAP